MRVRTYRNLHRNCLSIQARIDGSWRVVAYASRVSLGNAAFTVSEAGRQRVLAEGRKNVHAFVTGDLLAWDGAMRPEYVQTPTGAMVEAPEAPREALGVPVTYNPRKAGAFVRRDNGEAVQAAALALVAPDGITCSAT